MSTFYPNDTRLDVEVNKATGVVVRACGYFTLLTRHARIGQDGFMRLTDEAFAEFRALWEHDHPGEAITDDELRRISSRLLRAVALVLPDDNLSTPAA